MDIVEYFDPLNLEHLDAYAHLAKTGQWPDGFATDIITKQEYNPVWQVKLVAKIADCWLAHMNDRRP